MIERSWVQIPAGTAGEFSSPGSTFCADSYFVSVPPLCYRSSTLKIPVILPKVQVAGYSRTRIHLMYVVLYEVTRCMVAWCTQNLHKDSCSFMWHQPCQRCKYTTSVDVKKKKKHYKASHSCRTTCEHNESAQESGE